LLFQLQQALVDQACRHGPALLIARLHARWCVPGVAAQAVLEVGDGHCCQSQVPKERLAGR